MVEKKPWGKINERTIGNGWYVDEIAIERGGFSSIHFHSNNHNVFTVISGQLTLETFESGDVLIRADEINLGPQRVWVMEPRLWHRFFADSDCIVQEYYFRPGGKPITPEDIIRQEGFGNGLFGGNYSEFFEADEHYPERRD